jgi:hypothetical protein
MMAYQSRHTVGREHPVRAAGDAPFGGFSDAAIAAPDRGPEYFLEVPIAGPVPEGLDC